MDIIEMARALKQHCEAHMKENYVKAQRAEIDYPCCGCPFYIKDFAGCKLNDRFYPEDWKV